MSDLPNYQVHLFVCTNRKDKGSCCAEKSASTLRDNLKMRLQKDPELKGRVRVNNSGCLGECTRGITAVMYPQGQWFVNLTVDDEDVLYEAVVQALRG